MTGRPDRRNVGLKHYTPPTADQRKARIAALWALHLDSLVVTA